MEKQDSPKKTEDCFDLPLLVCLSCALFTAKAQTARITLNLQNATLEQAMDKIKAQTRYLFINRNVEDLESRKVSINVSNELITKVLDQLFTRSTSVTILTDAASSFINNRPQRHGRCRSPVA